MQKASTVFSPDEPSNLDYEIVRKTIADSWEKRAKELQARRWLILKQRALTERPQCKF